MSEKNNDGTLISVSEKYEVKEAAERAIVYVAVSFQGSNKANVHERCIEVAKEIENQITAMLNKDSGPVTTYAAEQIQTWSTRPWNKDGEILPLVFHSSVTYIVTFSDFVKLASWIDEIAEVEGVNTNRIAWELSEEKRKQLLVDVRQDAVRNAKSKAQDYAQGLGLNISKVVHIGDQGMVKGSIKNNGYEGMAFGQTMARVGGANSDKESIIFKPEAIIVSVVVEGVFWAS